MSVCHGHCNQSAYDCSKDTAGVMSLWTDLFCMSCCANCIPLGVPTIVMIVSWLPGLGVLMVISQDDWAL